MDRVLRSLEGLWTPADRFMLSVDGVEGEAGGGGGTPGSQPVEGDEGSSADRVAGDKGVREQMVPISRFNEVNNALKQYKALGDLSSVQKSLERARWMQDNPGKRYNEKELTEIESELRQIPSLQRAIAAAERFEKHQERLTKAYVADGNKRTEGFLQSMGREVNDKNRVALTNALTGIISSDEALMDRFLALDSTVFEEAFKQFKSGLVGDVKNIPGANLQAKKAPVQKTVAKTGSPVVREPKKELTEREALDEAGDAAFEMLLSHGES